MMRSNAKWIVIVLILAVLASLGFFAVGGSGTDNGSTGPSTGPSPTVVNISVAGKQVAGGGDISVKQGSAVTVNVEADVSDEVHVHGYDVKGDVTPGYPASITFTADAAGKFEIELEEKALQLAELTVSP